MAARKPFRPLYIVPKLQEVSHAVRAYNTPGPRETFWQVQIQRGAWINSRLSFFFERQAHADEFSLGGIYTASELLKLGPREPFVIQDVQQVKRYDIINPYTQKPTQEPGWKTTMRSSHGNVIETYTPYTAKFAQGRELTLQDLLGTTPAANSDTSAQLQQVQAAVQAADKAQKDAQALQDQLTAANAKLKKELAQVRAQTLALEQERAAIARAQAVAKAEQQAYLNALAQAKAQRAAQLNPVMLAVGAQQNIAAEQSAGQFTGMSNPGGLLSYQEVNNGGASGYYNGVYYARGTFTVYKAFGAAAAQAIAGGYADSFFWGGTFVPAYVENGVAIGGQGSSQLPSSGGSGYFAANAGSSYDPRGFGGGTHVPGVFGF